MKAHCFFSKLRSGEERVAQCLPKSVSIGVHPWFLTALMRFHRNSARITPPRRCAKGDLWSGLWIYGRVLMHSKSQSRVIRKPYHQGIIVGLYPKTDCSPARRGPMPRPDFFCDQQPGSRAGSIVALPVSLAQLSLYASGCDGSVGLRAFLTLSGLAARHLINILVGPIGPNTCKPCLGPGIR